MMSKIVIRGLLIVSLLCQAGFAWAQPNRSSAIRSKADIAVAGTAKLVCPVDTSRFACNVTNNHSTANLRWGDSTVSTTSGQKLGAGQAIEIRTTDAVYFISEDGSTSIIVSHTEEYR